MGGGEPSALSLALRRHFTHPEDAMVDRDGGGAEQQGDGQPENIEELQDPGGGSAMSGRRQDRPDDVAGRPKPTPGATSDAGSSASDRAGADDRAPRRAGSGDAG
jgi:hypothetical protein